MTANHAEKILEVRGLTKTYGGEAKKGAKQPTPTLDVLKGIDIDIYRGDVVCLIGPSGCGKSTFLRCLNRLEIPTSGSVKFEGTEVDEAQIDAVRQKMGMVFQHFNLFPHLTVKKNLELAPSLLKLKDKEAISQRADELLARYGHATAIVLARFVPVVRTVLHPMAGILTVSTRTFTLCQILGGLLWTQSVVLAGYALGSTIPSIDHYLLPIIALIVAASLTPLALELYRARRATTTTESTPK